MLFASCSVQVHCTRKLRCPLDAENSALPKLVTACFSSIFPSGTCVRRRKLGVPLRPRCCPKLSVLPFRAVRCCVEPNFLSLRPAGAGDGAVGCDEGLALDCRAWARGTAWLVPPPHTCTHVLLATLTVTGVTHLASGSHVVKTLGKVWKLAETREKKGQPFESTLSSYSRVRARRCVFLAVRASLSVAFDICQWREVTDPISSLHVRHMQANIQTSKLQLTSPHFLKPTHRRLKPKSV